MDINEIPLNERLNAELYIKCFNEQKAWCDWLLHKPPQEILHHAYEYTIREDLLLTLENTELSDEQCLVLLKSPSPMADFFHDFQKIDTDVMEDARWCIENRAAALIRKQRRNPMQ